MQRSALHFYFRNQLERHRRLRGLEVYPGRGTDRPIPSNRQDNPPSSPVTQSSHRPAALIHPNLFTA